MYDNGSAFSGRSRWPVLVRLALRCFVLGLFSAGQLANAGTAYEVRFWIRGGGGAPTHTAYGVAYTSAAEIVSKMQADGWVLSTEHYSTSNLNYARWICPFAMPGTNWHWDGRMTSDGDGSVLCNDNRKMYIMYPNWYYPNKSFTEMLNYSLQMCYNCYAGDTVNHGSGFVSWQPYVYACNTDVIPFWGWGNPPAGVKHIEPVFSADSTHFTGFNMELDPSIYPSGAIASGTGANGSVQFDAATPPHWVWTPGMEPTTEGGTSSADAAAIKASVDAVGAKLDLVKAASVADFAATRAALETARLQAVADAAASREAANTASAALKASVDAAKAAAAADAVSTRSALIAAQSAAAADAAAIRSSVSSDIASMKAQAASDASAARSAALTASAAQTSALDALRASNEAAAANAAAAQAAAQSAAAADALVLKNQLASDALAARQGASADSLAARTASAAQSAAEIAAFDAIRTAAASDAVLTRMQIVDVGNKTADLHLFVERAAADSLAADAAIKSAVDAAKAAAVADAAAIVAAITENKPESLDLSGVVSAVNGVHTAVDESKLAEVSELSAIKNLLSGDYTVEPAGGFVAPVETSDAEDLALVNEIKGKFIESKSVWDGVSDFMGEFFGSLIGNWRYLGRVAPSFTLHLNLPLIGVWDFVFDPTPYEWVFTLIRTIEVLVLWLMLGNMVLRLFGSMFGGNQ